MKPFEIQSGVYWIGALHPDLRLFDIIMYAKNGTTYNSYLIKDEKTAIIDTVKDKFADTYIEHITELIDPSEIDYIIMQHNEPDHSGALLKLLEVAPQAKVVCAKPAVKYVQNILNKEVDIIPVANKEELSLGNKTLQFFSAPYCHWPDTMMTYLNQEKMLFSCDLMGVHFCDSRMYNDQINRDFGEDFKYYFDHIMRPFKKNVQNAIKKIDALDISMICTSHGPILRTEAAKYIDSYREWSSPLEANDPPNMVIYYAAAHGNTSIMANKIAEGARSEGINVELFDAIEIDPMQHVDRIESADALLLGSPTINTNAVKPVWDVLNCLITIDVKGKLGASFGSYGWSADAVGQLDARLQAMKFKVPFDGLTAVLIPSEEELDNCFEYGVSLAKELRK
jgi:NADH oxidase (H2O-forming)